MDITQVVVGVIAVVLGVWWWWRVTTFMDTVENRMREIDRHLEKLTRGE
jgi:hypothetical protein